jgi:hypothetical protein
MAEDIIKAQIEIIQSYYIRIVMQQPELETIIQWLEDDLQTIGMENTLLTAKKIIKRK